MNKEELDKFLQKNSIRKNIFSAYKEEILYLRENAATLEIIFDFLCEKDNEIKNRYIGRKATAIAFLSNTIKKWQTETTTNKKQVKSEDRQQLKNEDKQQPNKKDVDKALDLLNQSLAKFK